MTFETTFQYDPIEEVSYRYKNYVKVSHFLSTLFLLLKPLPQKFNCSSPGLKFVVSNFIPSRTVFNDPCYASASSKAAIRKNEHVLQFELRCSLI